ncbi:MULTISPECIES: hypothetical protein [Elizabethkingia]|uniref:hypothetical protein n=1 Tax=Elizabethkingia TaxID=308865 RepID=UPI0021A8A432|nr:hypothetical protein [Elizabethkingia anophelis]MCT4059588.1 hypothetical protein [Elizabethkingia anophelis]MCT4070197.1 hypothetical protein [Elizabethkingia anophelis]MCT4320638.1 hypothetical protein [Elizabethkingia anophelis]
MKNNSHIVDRKPDSCPLCQGKIVPIIYGLFFPESQTVQKAMKGELILGGCVISPDNDPKWACKDCGTQFLEGSTKSSEVKAVNPLRHLYHFILKIIGVLALVYIIASNT